MFDEERRRVDAWAKVFATDGFEAAQEAEREEIALIRKEKDENDLKNFKAFEKLMLEGKAVKEAREKERKANLGTAEAGTNSDQENMPDSTNTNLVNPFSGEEVLPTKESPSLTLIREQRLADTLSGKTSQMVENAIREKNKKKENSSSNNGDSSLLEVTTEEDYDNKAEWTKCHIVEEVDDDETEDMEKGGSTGAPTSIDLDDIDIDDDDMQSSSLLDLDTTPEQSSLSLLAALDQPPVSSITATGGTDLFELD